jgi:hypothetical protein
VLFLNGLPIVLLELKHEAGAQGWNVHTAVSQYARRDHAQRIFQLPFLYIAADTSEVKVATDPRREENFRWFNTGLANQPMTPGEYPVEFLYREVLGKDRLLEALAFFLVHVPAREAEEGKPARPAFSIFPVTTRAAWCGGWQRRRWRASSNMGTSAANSSSTIRPAAARRYRSAGWRTACMACSSRVATRSWWIG